MSAESERRLELGRQAQELLDSPIFEKVVTHLTGEYIKKLTAEQVGSLTAASAHATLRALNDIKADLKVLASEVAVQSSKSQR